MIATRFEAGSLVARRLRLRQVNSQQTTEHVFVRLVALIINH